MTKKLGRNRSISENDVNSEGDKREVSDDSKNLPAIVAAYRWAAGATFYA